MSLWVRFPAQRIVKEKTVKPEFSFVAFKSNNHQAGVSFLNFHGPRSCQQSGDIFLGSTPNAGTVKEKTVKPRHLFTLPPFPLVSGVLYVSTLGRAADVPSVWFESIFCMVRRVAGDRSKDDVL